MKIIGDSWNWVVFKIFPFLTKIKLWRIYDNLTFVSCELFYFLAGIISLLEEPMPELKIFALKKLDLIVDEFWPEISEAIEKM